MHTKDFSLVDDLSFKYVFHEEDILRDFINSYFDYLNEPITLYLTNIETQKQEFSIHRSSIRTKN